MLAELSRRSLYCKVCNGCCKVGKGGEKIKDQPGTRSAKVIEGDTRLLLYASLPVVHAGQSQSGTEVRNGLSSIQQWGSHCGVDSRD